MRAVRHIIIISFICLLLLFERTYPVLPFTWMVLCFFSLRVRLAWIVMISSTLLADFALALPLGSSAVVCAIFMASISLAPKKMLTRGIFFALVGALLGIVYGITRQSLSLEIFLFSSAFCAVLYTFGSTISTIEEIGHVQE